MFHVFLPHPPSRTCFSLHKPRTLAPVMVEEPSAHSSAMLHRVSRGFPRRNIRPRTLRAPPSQLKRPTLHSCRNRRAPSGAPTSARGRAQCLQAIAPQRRQGTRCARGPTGDGVTSPINPLYTLDSGLCPLASPTPRTAASSRTPLYGLLSLILPVAIDVPPPH
ncbi:uncharacterized protein SCHCODRAFT_02086776 [Schizophyllum commune H4-8]|uniref:uncharacterized protein n=1 Tax=Schizophyllum commune (strain H4-8 / FGSC 9210) TaxID=578458 RepID=UPI002160C70E|nr:uncharacterized protein SCHCODRAFT_02086776 [Schizophyllum commune H4-8]KAI5887012.1 hypothetical protein SCHCODRAFT_02086776 [Schizophyllum commune H4-8]